MEWFGKKEAQNTSTNNGNKPEYKVESSFDEDEVEKLTSTNNGNKPCPSCGRTLQPLWFCPNEKCGNHE